MDVAMVVTPGTAVISGALSIIGSAYADHLASKGYDLLLIDRHRGRLNRMAAALTTRTRRAVEVVVVSRGSESDLAAALAQIEQDASISVVVNIARRRNQRLPAGAEAEPIGALAVRKFLSARGMVSTCHAEVFIATGHVADLPPLF